MRWGTYSDLLLVFMLFAACSVSIAHALGNLFRPLAVFLYVVSVLVSIAHALGNLFRQ